MATDVAVDHVAEKAQPSSLQVRDAPATKASFYRPLKGQHMGPRKVFIPLQRRFREVHARLQDQTCWAQLPGAQKGQAVSYEP